MPNPPKATSAKATTTKVTHSAAASTSLTLVSTGSKGKHPTPATSPALANLGKDLDLLSVKAQAIIAGNVTTLLNEALAPAGVASAKKVDREAALIYVTTHVVNAVWRAASTAAQATLPPEPGKTITMRATPLGKPHKGCLRFFVCDTDGTETTGKDSPCC